MLPQSELYRRPMVKQLKYMEFIRANQFHFLKERMIIKQEIIQIWITPIKRISRNQDKDFKIMKTDPDNQDMIQQLLNDSGVQSWGTCQNWMSKYSMLTMSKARIFSSSMLRDKWTEKRLFEIPSWLQFKIQSKSEFQI